MINFDEFEHADRHAWQEEAERLLKGKPLSKLNWYYEPDIDVAPYYDKSDIIPDQIGWLGGSNSAVGFRIIELLDLDSNTNEMAQNALNMGAEGVLIESINKLKTYADIGAIWPEHCWFGMKCGVSSLSEITSFFESRNSDRQDFVGFVGLPWVRRKSPYPDYSVNLDILHESTRSFSAYKNLRTIEIPLHLFQEEGASITMELCTLLGLLKTVIDNSRDQNIAIDTLPRKILISTAVSTDFYHEIAKIRAIRKLAFKLFRLYDIPCRPEDFSVVGRTSSVVESTLDSDTNFLRKTTQALSIVLGTADGLIVTSFETGGYDEEVRRITRNIGNLIKEESYGHWVQDPLAGSYYIEALTEKLCEAGWGKFQKTETEGGFLEYISNGDLSADIVVDQNRIWEEVNTRGRTLVGVNNYPNGIDKFEVDDLRVGFRHSKHFEALRYQLHQSLQSGKLKQPAKYTPHYHG